MIVLFGLIIFQQIYWSIVVHRLVNKLMSRSFFEYKQAEQAFTEKPKRIQEPEPEEDIGVLSEIGQL